MVINQHDPGLVIGTPVLNQDISGMKVGVAASRAMQPGDLKPHLSKDLYPLRIPYGPLPEPLGDGFCI
jgi:hypothetical protein